MTEYHFIVMLENGNRYDWRKSYKRYQDAQGAMTRQLKKLWQEQKSEIDYMSITEVQGVDPSGWER